MAVFCPNPSDNWPIGPWHISLISFILAADIQFKPLLKNIYYHVSFCPISDRCAGLITAESVHCSRRSRRKTMSAINGLATPAEPLFQPADEKENASFNREAKFNRPDAICESEPQWWKLP